MIIHLYNIIYVERITSTYVSFILKSCSSSKYYYVLILSRLYSILNLLGSSSHYRVPTFSQFTITYKYLGMYIYIGSRNSLHLSKSKRKQQKYQEDCLSVDCKTIQQRVYISKSVNA